MTAAPCMRQDRDEPCRHVRFSLRFPATELDARASVHAACARLRDAGVPALRAGEIEIALAEAVNNVVEHAYAGADAGPVRLSCSLLGTRLDIRLCDIGRPLPGDRLPPGLAADVDVPLADLPEGGFGWFLIRSLATEIRYDRCGASNHLSLRFEL